MENNNNNPSIEEELNGKRKEIQNKVIALEKYNYNQKEHTTTEMVDCIRKIIEEVMNK